MEIGHILHLEVVWFLALLSALLVYRMLTRQIGLNGLLTTGQPGQVSPERVQLLLTTLAISAHFVSDASHSTTMPDVNTTSLVLFGASGSVYAMVKGLRQRIGF